MTIRKLHPDWPEFDTTASAWSIDGPAGEIAAALDYSGKTFATATGPSESTTGFALAEIARVVRYRISYNDGYYGWNDDAPDDATNGHVWRPDNQISGSELEMHVVGELIDGRWFSLVAGNDYTGWGCMGDSADIRIGESEERVVEFGLDQTGRRLLGYEAAP